MLPIRKLTYFLLLLSISFLAGCEIEGYFRAEPDTIIRGESATLIWDLEQYSAQADSASIEPEIGSVRVNGSYTVRPDETTTYTITWTGKDLSGKEGTATEKTTVTVTQPPECSLEASSETIIEGEPITLSWTSKNADSYVIDPHVGDVDPEGWRVVYPAGDTTYTLKVSGPGGTAEASVSITTRPSITITEPDGVRDYAHESFVVKWIDVDTDDAAQIALYYDTDNTGADGVLIAGGINEDQDSTHDTVIWTTEQVPEGSYYIYAVIDDGKNEPLTDYSEFKVLVDHHTPRFNDIPSQSVIELDTLSFDISANDPNFDSLTYSASNLPEGANFDSASRNFTWTPSLGQTGSYDVRFLVADGVNTDTFDVKISVYKHPVSVTLNADQDSIKCGESTTLSWSSIYAESCTIEPSVGTVGPEGSVFVSPSAPTSYTITATGESGTATDWVTVGINPPEVAISCNPSEIQYGESATLSWSTSCADSCVIEPEVGESPLNGSAVVTPDQSTVYTITATGPGGTTQKSVNVKVVSPPRVMLSVSHSEITYGEPVTLSWSVENAGSTPYINQGIGAVMTEGSIELTPDYTTTYAISVSNEDKSVFHTITVRVVGSPPPTPLSEGSFGEKYQDIVPVDASLESYDEKRFVVLTGLVNDINDSPLSGVRVEVFNHPEYGSALTDSEGRFSIPAEGGGVLKLVYTKEGYITSHRQKETPWNDVVILDSIVLIEKDIATTVTFDGNPGTIITHKSTKIIDPEFGDRSCTMVFTGDNMAYEMDKYGNVIRPLSTIATRATEFTTPESMPSILPPASAFTYCSELGVDGVERVKFDKSVIMYVDNFLGFPVGGIVPVGYYDRDKGQWIPSENGVVVELLDTNSDGFVDALDSDGDKNPDDLDNDGVFLDEIEGLDNSTAYTPGTTYWRVSVKHFTPWDCNWPYGPSEDAVPPNPNGEPDIDSDDPVCFAEGTLVHTSSGLVPIEKVTVSDRVWSYNENSHQNELQEVTRTYINPERKLIELEFENGSGISERLKVTPDHPFRVVGRGWVPAVELFPQDRIDSFNGDEIVFKSVKPIGDHQSVYNIEVENTHTYFVGEQGLLVHNACNGNVDPKKRVLHLDIPLAGTDMTLHYASNRIEEYQHDITVPASGDSVPSSLKRIEVSVEVAGQTFYKVLPALSDQKVVFGWDGKNHLGDYVYGTINAEVSVAFVYDAVYLEPSAFGSAFGRFGNVPMSGTRARQEIRLYKKTTLPIDNIISDEPGKNEIAEGWALSSHHYGVNNLFKGNGTVIKNNQHVITSIAGIGFDGGGGDGGPATQASLFGASSVAVDTFGNIYIADTNNNSIRKIDTSGIITTIAGLGRGGSSYAGDGDGGPAVKAYIKTPQGVAVDAFGNIYIAESGKYRIRKIDPNGIITTIAGTGIRGYSGDGGLATEAEITWPNSVDVDTVGNIYFTSSSGNCIRKIDTNGIITTIAGTDESGYSGDGGLAVYAKLNWPDGISLDASGNIYFADANNYCVRKIDTSGIITTIAGTGVRGYSGDGGLAVEARLYRVLGVQVDASGNVYMVDTSNNRIRKVNTSGIITTFAGNGESGYIGDGTPALEAALGNPTSITEDALGNIYVTVALHKVFRIGPAAMLSRNMSNGDISFVDGNMIGYIMAATGNHKKTIDLKTGKMLLDFSYDGNRLQYITDQFGKQIEIRYQDGIPVEIASPYGQTTSLTIEDNQLKKVIYPDDSFYEFNYINQGLMQYAIDPELNRCDFDYNGSGRLTDVYDSEDGHWNYTRSSDAGGDVKTTTVTTGEGNQEAFIDHTFSTGEYSSISTKPSGDVSEIDTSADGLTATISELCGMDIAIKYGLDPEYYNKYVKEITNTSGNGLTQTSIKNITYEDTNSDDVPDIITERNAINGKTTTLVHNVLASTKTVTTPENRTVTSSYDETTLLTTNISVEGLNDVSYTYYPAGHLHYGRLHYVTSGIRETEYIYYDDGNIHTIIGPDLKETIFEEYDLMGRVKLIRRPDKTTVKYEYDDNGNMTALINPSEKKHEFGYNGVDLRDTYTTPHPRGYSYKYDRDRRLTHIYFPSTKEIFFDYDDGSGNKSLLQEIITPEGIISYTYACGSRVDTITKDTESIKWGYDDDLVTSIASNGVLSQTVSYRYDNDGDFTMDGFTYAGKTHELSYDNDGLLTGSGDYTVTRKPENGLPDAVTGGALSLYRSFNGYGEIDGVACTVGGVNAASWAVTNRDNAGRIKEKTETIDGVTDTYSYDYDDNGRLEIVTKNGTIVEEYGYSKIPYGTCTVRTNTLRGITAQDLHYDEDDRLLSIGDTSYFYDDDGFLESKVKGDETTTYTYSSRGELLSVTLPNSTAITYLHDPLGRRISKQVNGITTEKYLWEGLTTLLAVFDGSDNLIMRFEYADDRMPVSMTKGSDTYTLLYDQVGTLRAVADSSGNIVKQVAYDTFGYILSDTNDAFTVPFGFAGGLHDRDTGLVRFGYRDYDPEACRWTAKDPMLFEGGDTDLYGYVLNDPVNWIDPEGLWGIVVGGSAFGFDFSSSLYDSDKGWFPSNKMNASNSTTLFGGGIQFTFDTPIESRNNACDDLNVSIGMGKYLGVTYNTELTHGSVNLGLGLGLPITFSKPLKIFFP